MPITRRRRANPPDQPENNHHQSADQPEGAVEQSLQTEPAPASALAESTENVVTQSDVEATLPVEIPEDSENPAFTPPVTEQSQLPGQQPLGTTPMPPGTATPLHANNNGDRNGTVEYTPIEGGRRTARGELFRRPPQVPQPPQAQGSFVSSAPLQAPTHEITLPLGNLLHLAYNPGYTGSEEARSLLLHRLSEESKAGGRARCWNCGSLAIAYDRWNTRSRSFGEVGVAFCEICGVWSVM